MTAWIPHKDANSHGCRTRNTAKTFLPLQRERSHGRWRRHSTRVCDCTACAASLESWERSSAGPVRRNRNRRGNSFGCETGAGKGGSLFCDSGDTSGGAFCFFAGGVTSMSQDGPCSGEDHDYVENDHIYTERRLVGLSHDVHLGQHCQEH